MVRAFSRWSIRIEFATVHEPGGVSAFFNLGSDRLKQYIGRQSKYFQAWTLANGGLPRKGEQMSPEKRIRGGVLPPCEKDCRGARRKRERSLCVLALSRFCLADERPPSVRNSAERRKIRRIGPPLFLPKTRNILKFSLSTLRGLPAAMLLARHNSLCGRRTAALVARRR